MKVNTGQYTIEDIELIRKSELFDSKWYVQTYPDVKSLDIEPAEHYLALGWILKRDPSPLFSTRRYLALNVAIVDTNPLVHFLRFGKKEGQDFLAYSTQSLHLSKAQEINVQKSYSIKSSLVEYEPVRNIKSHNNKAVVYHLFYPELVLEAIETINEFDFSYDKIFTVSESLSDEFLELIRCSTSARIFITSNTGRDIYPFWLLIKQGMLDQYELVCKLHGKKSLHRGDGDEWRKDSINVLCGNQERISYIENIFSEKTYPDLCFIAPSKKALLVTEERHWKGNMHWVKEITGRLGKQLDIPDVTGKPIMAGSFYWLNEKGISKFRKLPITYDDWVLNHNSGNKIDGNLEHFVERSLLLHIPLEKMSETVAGFITDNGGINIYRSDDGNINKKQFSQNELNPIRDALQINLNNLNYESNKYSHIIGAYEVINEEKCVKISGYITDVSNPGKHFTILIYHHSKLLCKLQANQACEIGAIIDVSNGNYGFSIELTGVIDVAELKIYEQQSGQVLPVCKDNNIPVEITRTLLTNNRTNSANYISPERVRSLNMPVSNYLALNKLISTETMRNYINSLAKEDAKRPVVSDGAIRHVFIVNNPISEIAVARIIETKKLQHKECLIILHRVEYASLLEGFPEISSGLKDVEQLFIKTDLLNMYDFINSIIREISPDRFILYAHHYFAIFTHVLGMHPLCLKTNLIEEGNLSSVPNWEAQNVSKVLQYTNQKSLINKSDVLSNSNSLLQIVGSSEFDYFSYTLLKRHFPDEITTLNSLHLRYGSLFENECQHLSLNQFIHLLLLRRYYLWHPKMVGEFELYSLSKAFTGMYGLHEIKNPSVAEKTMLNIYQAKMNNQFALILLPSPSRFSLFQDFNKNNDKYAGFFKSLTPESKVFYLLHPASRVNNETRLAAENALEKYPIFNTLKAQNLCDVLGQNPVTEIVATCFRYVIHYGSSISLVLRQYKTDTEEIYLDRFK